MFKILNFLHRMPYGKNKIVEKLLVFRCYEIQDTTYDIRYTRYDTIMQNKPNFRKAQMNVNFYSQKDYENETAFGLRENKPKQSQFLYHWLRLLFIIVAPLLAFARKQGG
ncbi:hypothetical protein ES703_66545 [subsurface metagenome]